jgi:photosystem II stability/assembly factor-like uncharacterized protein
VLEYTGKPIVVPFACTLDDIQSAGMTCSDDEPCAIYLELTAVESVGTKLFVTGNIHASASTLYTALLGSEDGGRTWREVADRIRASGLDHIQFADSETGWASGQLLSPLPQDPFLLLTTDGGKTWRRQPLFSETHYGSIQQFFFPGKTGGSLIIDQGPGADGGRYQLYESPDSGESWLIKEESNKPLKLKRTAPVSDWRVRADGPTQAYHIERRQGDRWTTAAAFAVKLAPCKPPAPEASPAVVKP